MQHHYFISTGTSFFLKLTSPSTSLNIPQRNHLGFVAQRAQEGFNRIDGQCCNLPEAINEMQEPERDEGIMWHENHQSRKHWNQKNRCSQHNSMSLWSQNTERYSKSSDAKDQPWQWGSANVFSTCLPRASLSFALATTVEVSTGVPARRTAPYKAYKMKLLCNTFFATNDKRQSNEKAKQCVDYIMFNNVYFFIIFTVKNWEMALQGKMAVPTCKFGCDDFFGNLASGKAAVLRFWRAVACPGCACIASLCSWFVFVFVFIYSLRKILRIKCESPHCVFPQSGNKSAALDQNQPRSA